MDVGLGKTIEAGYILRELEAHEDVERVLIIVPAGLEQKIEGHRLPSARDQSRSYSSGSTSGT